MRPMPLIQAAVWAVVLSQWSWSSVLISPFRLDQVDSATISTINELFVEAYQSFSSETVIKPDSGTACHDKTSALEAGKKAGATEVIYGVARKLGEKWIVSGWRLNVGSGSTIVSNRLDSRSIEDFEFVMKRMAEGLAKGKNIDETASIDNVSESEMDESSYRRREGFYAFGFKSGFLFPRDNGYYSRYVYDYSGSSGSSYKLKSYSQVLNTDFINWFELPRDLALEWDLHVGWMNEIGTHFSLLKIFSRKDFAPFAGGGIGVDYVFPDEANIAEDKRNAGFALQGKAGMLLLRTYSFRIITSIGYKVVLNSDLDQGLQADIGILWKKNPRSHVRSSGNPLVGGLAIIGGIVVGLAVLGIATAAL